MPAYSMHDDVIRGDAGGLGVHARPAGGRHLSGRLGRGPGARADGHRPMARPPVAAPATA